MKNTAISVAKEAKRSMRSLALNVHFKHPDLGMKEYEILSRATAFLLNVDPPNPQQPVGSASTYEFLKDSRKERDDLIRRQDYSQDPAGGAPRKVKDLGWLEFCPGHYRPLVHIIAASHVLSPWMWKNYYPQPWLEQVTQEHVRYSVGIYDQNAQGKSESLATFGLNPYPLHHPNNMDLALVHLKSEESSLKQMKSLGVQPLYLTENDAVFDKGDKVTFEGFEITEEHYEAMEQMNDIFDKEKTKKKSDEDTRVFIPFSTTGKLIFANPNRFLAKTESTLPEGVCGGPVIDEEGKVCGVVEGIVPTNHEEKDFAGSASFIPYFRIREFTDFAERKMLETIVPKKLFDKVVSLKEGKSLHAKGEPFKFDGGNSPLGEQQRQDEVNMDAVYHTMMESIRKTHTPEQVEAILGTVERERQEVMSAIDRDGGDLDEIIATVRARTREKQRQILNELEKSKTTEADIVEKSEIDKNS